MSITMDISAFRLAFPEFADEVRYPDAMITFWSSAGLLLLNETRWGDLLTHGLWLYVAHNITLGSADMAAGDSGVAPGRGVGGVMSSKGVDGVSVGYDTSSMTLEGAGNYNTTKYGREFWQLAMIVGMGGQQLI
jgi:hypothetical protein